MSAWEILETLLCIDVIKLLQSLKRQIDRILTEACPYVLLWNADSTRLLYWNRFGVPPTVLSKYGREDGALVYWWFDPDAAEDLADAMATGRSLPRRAPEVVFDEAFSPSAPAP